MHRFAAHFYMMATASKVRVYSESVEIEAMLRTLLDCIVAAKPACRSSLASLSLPIQLESFLYCLSPAWQGTLVDGRQHRLRNRTSRECFSRISGVISPFRISGFTLLRFGLSSSISVKSCLSKWRKPRKRRRKQAVDSLLWRFNDILVSDRSVTCAQRVHSTTFCIFEVRAMCFLDRQPAGGGLGYLSAH